MGRAAIVLCHFPGGFEIPLNRLGAIRARNFARVALSCGVISSEKR